MGKPGYITPPPGLIPSVPNRSVPNPSGLKPPGPRESAETTETVQRTERKPGLPIFVPIGPGQAPIPPSTGSEPTEETVAEVPETVAEPEPIATPHEPDPDRASASPTPRHSNAPPQWSLTLHDGSVIYVSGTLLLGRDPAQVDEWRTAGLLRINDPEKSVSKTHAGLDCRTGEFWITDLFSTNGIAVIAADGTETILEPDEKVSVTPGSTVELGRYAIHVDRQ